MGTAIADPVRGIVRVEGGALWEPAVEAAAAHGRAVLHGSSPDVGIAGYSLGGGIGWYARKLGLATNSLTAVELVIADGTLVRADATTNPELFWAVRGGGGSFGVVTALEFRMYDIQTAYAGMLMWDLARHRAGAARVGRLGARRPRRGHHLVPRDAAARRCPSCPTSCAAASSSSSTAPCSAPTSAAQELLGRACGRCDPEMDTFARVPAKSLVRLHMDPEGGAPVVVGQRDARRRFPDAAVDAFLAEVGPDATTSLLMAELRQLGGALGRPHEGGGVLSHLDARVRHASPARIAADAGDGRRRATPTRSASPRRWRRSPNGRQYLNFAENPVDPRAAYADGVWTQLTGIRSAVDPHGIFVANHPVPRLCENGAADRLSRDRVSGAGEAGWRVQSVPGGPASSQDWKPIRDGGLIASSTSPSGVVQRITTWSG